MPPVSALWADSGRGHAATGIRRVELTGCVFHGLRKEAASRLAEAGCTVHEIMAVTGHSSLQMIQHYSRQAGQRGMASAAILKLDVKNRK